MNTASKIIAGLGGDQRTGMCRCPAHDDKKPSLHVSEGRKGVVFYCHAGCSQDAVINALKERGLWSTKKERVRVRVQLAEDTDVARRKRTTKELLDAAEEFEEWPQAYLRRRGIKLSPRTLKLLGTSTMHLITGKMFPAMVAAVTNKNGKKTGVHVTYLTRDTKKKAVGQKFPARQMYGAIAGGMIILERADPRKPLIVGEGIETVLSAMQIAGLPGAVALSAGNMAKLNLPEAAEYIIAADNDRAGLKAAAVLAERLRREGRQVRVAIPPLEATDWNDVLQGDGAEECWQAALDTNHPQELAGPVAALNEREFMKLDFPERELLLDPWLPRPGLAMIYAPKGEGKTWLALTIAKAVARGQDLLGWRCRSRSRVLYVEGELPGKSVQGRLEKFRPSPDGMLFVLCRDDYLLHRTTMPDLGEPQGRLELNRIIDQCRPDVIIIDTISTMVRSGVENDAESWAPIQAWLLSQRWQGRTVILMHHSGKSGQQRGTSKREDVMDTIIKLKKQPDEGTDTESVFDLMFEKSRDFYGKDAEPMRLRFSVVDGRATWRAEPMRDVQADKVREMQKAGMKQKDIAREMGLSPGRVSQIVKEIRESKPADAQVAPSARRRRRVRENESVKRFSHRKAQPR